MASSTAHIEPSEGKRILQTSVRELLVAKLGLKLQRDRRSIPDMGRWPWHQRQIDVLQLTLDFGPDPDTLQPRAYTLYSGSTVEPELKDDKGFLNHIEFTHRKRIMRELERLIFGD